jgi:hypothetical protein
MLTSTSVVMEGRSEATSRACKALYSGSIPLAASSISAGQRPYVYGSPHQERFSERLGDG